MSVYGDNPYDDGLDFIGCPPDTAEIRLPKFPDSYKADAKLIRWARKGLLPDGERRMITVIEDFRPVEGRCGVFMGQVTFIDSKTMEKWYTGALEFYYTRNYDFRRGAYSKEDSPTVAFRFIAKGDLERLSDKMPEQTALILCTKETKGIESYKRIFVYGGLDIIYEPRSRETRGFFLNLGHNDGWYTHHPKCSKRPIDPAGMGDYIGHYCDRGWLFVSPGRNFVFNPRLQPPTGRFLEEALRRVGEKCLTEETLNHGFLKIAAIADIDTYQKLEGWTICETHFESVQSCMGYVDSGKEHDHLVFLSMGHWIDLRRQTKVRLHLVEGSIGIGEEKEIREGRYFYGFSTYSSQDEFKLVDLADNPSVGQPDKSEYLLYLFNPVIEKRNPKELLIPIDPKLTRQLYMNQLDYIEKRKECVFEKS